MGLSSGPPQGPSPSSRWMTGNQNETVSTLGEKQTLAVQNGRASPDHGTSRHLSITSSAATKIAGGTGEAERLGGSEVNDDLDLH